MEETRTFVVQESPEERRGFSTGPKPTNPASTPTPQEQK